MSHFTISNIDANDTAGRADGMSSDKAVDTEAGANVENSIAGLYCCMLVGSSHALKVMRVGACNTYLLISVAETRHDGVSSALVALQVRSLTNGVVSCSSFGFDIFKE